MAPTLKTTTDAGSNARSQRAKDKNLGTLVVPSPPASGGVAFNPPTTTATATTSASVSTPSQPNILSPEQQQQQHVDFIGSSAAVKDLFSLPYTSRDQVVSVAIHNIDGTLVFDQDDPRISSPSSPSRQPGRSFAHKRPLPGKTAASLLQHEQRHFQDENSLSSSPFLGIANDDELIPNTKALVGLSNSEGSLAKNNEALALVNSFLLGKGTTPTFSSTSSETTTSSSSSSEQPAPETSTTTPTTLTRSDSLSDENQQDEKDLELQRSRPGYEYVHEHIPTTPEPRQYLSWKFHDHHLWVGSDTLIVRDGVSKNIGNASLSVRVEDAQEMQAMVKTHEQAVQSGTFQADHQFSVLQQQGKPSYATKAAKKRREPEVIQTQKHTEEGKTKDDASQSNNTTSKSSPSSFSAPDLDQVKLQTCIVPSPSVPVGGLLDSNNIPENSLDLSESSTADDMPGMEKHPKMVSPVSTVLDAYLDNIMANVPQLALCLREKGFIQSVKLMETKNIPSAFLHPSTADTSKPFEVVGQEESERVFSPQVMEMNATALLRFLKVNCNKDNATYLLRREMGQTNIHLYDISSISATKQRKWVWWLAMMSCRFAHRLKHISVVTQDRSKRRSFRNRERALLMNALDLLEVLSDMESSGCSNGSPSSSTHHESLIAGVRESLADTYLRVEDGSHFTQSASPLLSTDNSDNDDEKHGVRQAVPPEPATLKASSQQPYVSVTVDALNKAHDYLSKAIKCLLPHFESMLTKRGKAHDKNHMCESPVHKVSTIGDGSSSSEEEDEDNDDALNEDGEDDRSLEVIATATQLFGLHEKIVNVSLRLAEIHLRNYYSSSAMQSLRSAARMIADSLYILGVLSGADKRNRGRYQEWLRHVQLQYVWLWEHCGHFSRSFSSDSLWRDRGHAAVDDILCVLQDAEAAFTCHLKLGEKVNSPKEILLDFGVFLSLSPLVVRTNNFVNLDSLSGIVDTAALGKTATKQKKQGPTKGIDEAKNILTSQKFLQREQRKAIIAACLAYQSAINAFELLDEAGTKSKKDAIFLGLLQQRNGDSCNEVGKILLKELRTQLSSGSAKGEALSDAAASVLLSSAEFWFNEGLHAFEKSGDIKNLVLLRCNLCQCKKLRANALFDASNSNTHPEECLQEAAAQLEAAHEALGERGTDSALWDMVSAELAATFLVLGVRRRQALIGSGNAPMLLQLRLSPGQERSIVDPMERALGIYESSGNQHQAAAAHYQLALFFSKVWTSQRDETKTREKLGAAFRHYSAAHQYFTRAVDGNELTLCLVSLDLSNLYSSVQGEEGNAKALLCCMDTLSAIASGAGEKNQEGDETSTAGRPDDWYHQMDTVAATVEERVFKLLRSLVKLFDDQRTKIPYKDVYRAALTAKMMSPKATSSEATVDREQSIERLRGVCSILRATDDALSKLGLK